MSRIKKRVLLHRNIAAYRVGARDSYTSIDGIALKEFFAAQIITLFGFLDMISGGHYINFLFALVYAVNYTSL
jgi:hypothetical protein